MSVTNYFLGANTPQGFYSHYDTLLHDGRIRRLILLKGGPGCGKSTLMRHVSAAAQQKGYDAEEILCSSDPSSLDGLIIPQAGLAIADGTAPHVLEPALCGLGAKYLDLGRFYNEDVMQLHRTALLEAQHKNKACYPLCYLSLEAAAAAAALSRQIAAEGVPSGLLAEQLEQLLPSSIPHAKNSGEPRNCFLTSFTPEGIRFFPPPASKLLRIRDSYGLSGPFLAKLLSAYQAHGHAVVAAYDPLFPERVQAVWIPALDTAYIVSSRLFPVSEDVPCALDLDALAAQRLHYASEQHLHAAEQLLADAVDEALRYLRAAKRHHDALETACRPAVDFAAVSACAEEIAALL